ncbi:MAG: hypothetical protein R2818_01935 [Flavobacteriales bacterium]
MIWKAEYYFEIDSLEKALNGDDQWPGFLTIADDFGSTPSGNLANYYLGTIYMQASSRCAQAPQEGRYGRRRPCA